MSEGTPPYRSGLATGIGVVLLAGLVLAIVDVVHTGGAPLQVLALWALLALPPALGIGLVLAGGNATWGHGWVRRLFARLQLPGSGQYRAILIPDEAVGTDQSQKFVYVVDAQNKAQYRTVKIGPMIDGLRVVREGLAPEDRVVVAGIQRVRPGLVVDPEQVPATAVAAN